MGKKNNVPDLDDELLIEMTDEEGNTYYYVEEFIVPVGEERYAFLSPVHDEEHECCHDDDCDCDCDCEDEIIIAKIVEEEGEEIYVEPTDEEFMRVQEEYERLVQEDAEDE